MANKIRKYGTKVNDKESELIMKFISKLKVVYFGEETDVEIISFDIINYNSMTYVLVGARVKKHMTHNDKKRYKSGEYKSLGLSARTLLKLEIEASIVSQIDAYIKLFASPRIYRIELDKLSLE